MEKMRAVRKLRPGKGFELANVERPTPGKGELLIKVRAASMCGTDVHIYNWEPPWPRKMKLPKTIGHEVCGEVAGLGRGVKGFEEGDSVSAESHISCGRCYMCRAGNRHICQNLEFFSIHRDGFWAEYAVLPQQNAWKNPASMKPEVATLQESMGNSVYTVLESDVRGKTVAIFGSGPTGLFATGICRSVGAAKVIVVYGSRLHGKIAKKMGAGVLVNRHEQDPVLAIREETEGRGADVVLEMSGSGQALQNSLKAVRVRGQVTALGLPPKPESLDVSNDIVLKDITLRGIYGRKVWDTWKETSRLLKRLDISPVITHRLRLGEWEKGIEAMLSGSSGKVVLFPDL
jgi:threonine 3-dehydrogenase